MSRWARRIVKTVAALVVLVLVLAGAGYVATQTSWFRNWARGFGETQADRLLNGRLSIGRLDGSLWNGATLSDVRITQDGREVVHVDRVRVTYSWRQLLSRNFLFPEITLTRPTILLIHDAGGWRIANLVRPRQNESPNAQPVRLPSLVVEDGTVNIEDTAAGTSVRLPKQLRSLQADVGLTLARGSTDLVIRRATFEAMDPALAVSALSGHWTARNGRQDVSDLDLRTSSSAVNGRFAYQPGVEGASGSIDTHLMLSPVDLKELAGIVPGLAGHDLVLSGSIDAQGPLNALPVAASVSDPQAGTVTAKLVLSTAGDARTIKGRVVTTKLDLAPVLNNRALASYVTSTNQVDLTFTGGWSFDRLRGTVVLDSSGRTIWGYRWDRAAGTVRFDNGTLTLVDGSARAYGATATVAGTIEPAATPVRYALKGHVANVDVRALPPQLRVPKLETVVAGAYDVTGQGGRVNASATFDDSRVEGADVQSGATARFNNEDGTLHYGFAGHVTHVDVQRFGRALEIMAISTDDYASDITGQLAVDGAGSSLDTLTLDATSQLEPSTAFATQFGPADLTARIAGRTLTTSYRGAVGGFDVGRLTRRDDLTGSVGGMADIEATLAGLGDPFDLGRVTARGSVTLDQSRVGPLVLDMARVEASLANRTADITTFEANGPSLTANASGRLALGDTGSSSLKYTLSVTRLADLGPLVGRMLDGRVQLDGTITGNRAELVSNGSAVFSELKIDDQFDALTLDSTVEAHLPNLDVQQLRANVKADSTLLAVAGRTIPELTATVAYTHDRFQFEATANERGRTITAAGDLALLEGGREVTINRAALTAGSSTWSLLDAGPVRIRYEPGLVTLPQSITLVNNGQELSAEGTLALDDDHTGQLDVTVSGVDLTALGSLLLVNRQLAGTLTGDARIAGSPVTRSIVGNVKVLAGIVDGYAFQSFDALVDYRGERAQVDSILIQSPTSKLEATGRIPVSLTKGVLTDQPIMVDVTSAGIDLAVLEAANTGLVDVTGLLVVDAHITGTGTAPVASGSIKVQQGAFTVAATGAKYRNATIDAALQGEELRITSLTLHDNEGDALQGSGRVVMVNRAVRDIEFVVTGNDFTVLDNDYGRVSVDASLNVSGTVTAAKVGGLVRLHSARIEVDRLLERFGSSPYEAEPQPAGDQAAATASDDTVQPIGLNLTVQVPDNLILRGRDLRTDGSAVGLGDVNITAGGDFTLVREGRGSPVLVGTITTVRGTYDFQGRRFQVVRDGTITFRGDTPIDPALDVTAERTISGIVARVMVGGTMRSPELMLSSQPPLDQTDILSLIVFNQPANRLGQGQATNLGERAASLAGGFVASPLSNTLGRALNLDIFEINPSDDEGQGPSVTVGQQVGSKLFLRFRQLFGTRDASQVQLEYQLTDILRMQASIAEGQTSAQRSLTQRIERGGIDLVVFFSY